jgi:hypothetical protein
MNTPKREEILQLAKELYFNDLAKSGSQNFNNPEPCELAENGYLSLAQSMLMRSEDSEYKNHIEQEARELGLIRERPHFVVHLDLTQKAKARNDSKFASLIICLLWLLALVVALKGRW